jgi:hypothetical protein
MLLKVCAVGVSSLLFRHAFTSMTPRLRTRALGVFTGLSNGFGVCLVLSKSVLGHDRGLNEAKLLRMNQELDD